MAHSAAKAAGSSFAFKAICGITLLWMATGPLFHWSDTWQLVINTVTNIVSMLMVFLIQNTQNRESSALQLKIDELLRAVRGAKNEFINLEDLNEDDLKRLKERYAAMAVLARGQSNSPSGEIDPANPIVGTDSGRHCSLLSCQFKRAHVQSCRVAPDVFTAQLVGVIAHRLPARAIAK